MKKVVGAFLCILIIPLLAYAVVPLTANYQGYLTNAGGTPVNGAVTMTFSLYMAPSGGSPIWSETQSVSVDNGVYSVVLGAFNPLSLPFDAQYYLGVTVGADPEMVPRQALTSVPYAINADSAEVGYDLVCSGCVSLSELNFTPGDITGVTAGTGLSGGGTSGTVTLSVNPTLTQSRVSGTCPAGSSIRTINQNGTVVCEADTDTTYSAGTGLSLVGTTFSAAVPFSLSGSVSGGLISGVNGYAGSGYGVYGYASNPGDVTNYGGYFYAAGTSGRGIYGVASGTSARGVQGYATSTADGTNYGGYFQAYGTYGRGVEGYASNSGDFTNYGGFFQANGTSGRGVYGYASNSGTGINYGGFFQANGTSGRAVYGYAINGENVTNYGGYFSANGANGRGVYGATSGSSGIGVYGNATNSGDFTNYGGYFMASGTNGRGVYGRGTYGGYFVSLSGFGVYGAAMGSTWQRGGWFRADGTYGAGVYAEATGIEGTALQGYATGTSSTGVTGNGVLYDFYASGPGTNYGAASSIRWKSNIVEIDNALDKVLKLRGVYFDWDEEHGGQHDMGFIAEEVGAVIPEIVAYEPDGVYATGVDYGAITPVLVQAIKEQQKRIDHQKKLIDAQQEQIDQLMTEIQILKERM